VPPTALADMGKPIFQPQKSLFGKDESMIVKRLVRALRGSTTTCLRVGPSPRRSRFESLEHRALLAVVPFAANSSGISPAWFENLSHWPTNAEQPSGSLSGLATEIAWNGQTVEAQADEWIVQLSSALLADIASVSDTANLFSNSGLRVVRGLGKAGQVLVRATDNPAAAIEEWLRNHPAIEYFEPNFISELTRLPDDASFSQLWGLHNTGQTGGTIDADIDAPEAWDLATGSAHIVVGVIDTGVDYTHPDLAANIWTNPGEIAGNLIDDDANGFADDVHGYDFINDDSDPMDDNRHGTHVSGTIAGVGNNGQGLAGVNWSSSIMPLKFLSAEGSGSTADAVRALNYATMMRSTYGVNVRLTSNSWGGGGYSQALYAAIQASGEAGMLFVAAAGNSSRDTGASPSYPASYDLPNIISVAATDHNDRLPAFSNYGATSVDLAAPGVGIYSAVPNGGYGSLSGTSMAAPHVAGVVALLWSNAPEATPAQIGNALLRTCLQIEFL